MIYTIHNQQRKTTKIQHEIQHIKLKSITNKPYVLFKMHKGYQKTKGTIKNDSDQSNPKIQLTD